MASQDNGRSELTDDVESVSVSDDSLVINNESKTEQSSVLIQDQGPSKCDCVVPDDERQCHLTKGVVECDELTTELNHNNMENGIKTTYSNAVNEKQVEMENCDDSKEGTGYLNFGSGIERTLDNGAGHNALPPSAQRPTHPRPGVILLGRGNSFSLGRSEVIVLHHRPKSVKDRKSSRSGIGSNTKDEKLRTIKERQLSIENDCIRLNVNEEESGGVESSDYPNIPSPSPPPISNSLYHPDVQQNGESLNGNSSAPVIDLVPCYEDDLQDLWLKAESLMALRKDKVRKILEEFGIGEPGGGGGEDEDYWEDEDDVTERKKEEEEVWQIVQENYQV